MSDAKPMIAIVAMARNRVIGNAGKIPWHLPEDLRWFKEKTMGGALLMGRKTWDSIGRPLPGRETLVVSRGADIPGVVMVRNPSLFDADVTDRQIYVVGGSEIYREFLPQCVEVYVTEVGLDVEGDAFMPVFEQDFSRVETVREAKEYRIRWYRR